MNNLRNKRILITGYEGFLGSNLTLELLRQGAKVIGMDILTRRKYTLLKNSFNDIKIIRGSVADYNLVKNAVLRNKIEVVIHLAATSLVGDAYRHPLKTLITNTQGSWNVLEVVRLAKQPIKLIVASTDKAYGVHEKLPYKEDARLAGTHPYDVSKSCADLIAAAYYKSYRVPVCVTRCGNIYGPGDFNFSRIVPDAIRSALNCRTLLLRSDGKFTRDYIYVNDVVGAYITLLNKMFSNNLAGESFNFSNESPISVVSLVKEIFKLVGNNKACYKIINNAKNEIPHQFLASSKARRVLGWKPKYTLERGLLETIEWYSRYFKK